MVTRARLRLSQIPLLSLCQGHYSVKRKNIERNEGDKMNKKTSRKYSTGILAALSHPLRVSIYELIQKGAKTTIELEKILNENRFSILSKKSLPVVPAILRVYGLNSVIISKWGFFSIVFLIPSRM